MTQGAFLVGLILWAFLLNEMMKKASQPGKAGCFFCRVCGQQMEQVAIHWSYRLPFEVWAVVAKYNLSLNTVKRYLCPGKHTKAWYVPSSGERNRDVLVTKNLKKG